MGKQGKKVRNDKTDYSDERLEKTGYMSLRVNKLTYKNENQAKAAEMIKSKDLSFLIGRAGTGKTLIPIEQALIALRDRKS